ncbi:MAG: preprotein translocase subunit SecG [Thermoanaerobaculia bacterium]|nr:preprotein translocase subunit SecG [Thermoanaerobaculia bacterium]
MIVLLYTVHVLICFFLIAVVLLQQGKGADLSVFGGGATQTAFGARGAATVLHKMTVISFVLFIVTTLGIGIVQSKKGASDIFEGLDEEAAAAAATAGEDAVEEPAADEASEAPAEEPQGAFAMDTDASESATDGEPATSDESAEDSAESPGDESTEAGDSDTADEAGSETPSEDTDG